jgi:uncharacterized membrane protein YjfL (UPF0719 family)
MNPLCDNVVTNPPIQAHMIFMCHRIKLSVVCVCVYIYIYIYVVNLVNKQQALKRIKNNNVAQQLQIS